MKNILFKNLWLVGIILCLSVSVKSQSLSFAKTYGTPSDDEGHAIVALPGGDFVITGKTGNGANTSFFNTYLLKINAQGDTIWQHRYSGALASQGNSLTVTPNGNIFIAGSIKNQSTDSTSAYMLLTNSTGDTLWTRTFSISTGNASANTCIIDASGNLYAAGLATGDKDKQNGFLLKLTPAGVIEWANLYGDTGNDYFTNIKAIPGNNFLLTGVSNASGSDDIWLVKTDTAGNVLSNYSEVFPLPDNQIINGLGIAPDGGFLIAGNSTDSAFTDTQLLLLRFNNTDTALNWQSFVINSPGCSINSILYSSTDTSWVICGTAYNELTLSFDAFLAKVDDNGTTRWLNYFGGAGDDAASDVALCNNGDIIFTGYNASTGAGLKDVYIVRVSKNGDADGVETPAGSSLFSIQPNPFSDKAIVTFNPGINNSLQVYDLYGRMVKNIPGITSGSVIVSRETLPQGVYFIQLLNNGQITGTKKVIIE